MTITSNRYTSAIVFILAITICGATLMTGQTVLAQTETNQSREELIADLKMQIADVRERIERLQNRAENTESATNRRRVFAPQFPAEVSRRLEQENKASGELRVTARRITPEQTYRHPETGMVITREELRTYLQEKIAETRMKIQNEIAKRMESQPVQAATQTNPIEQVDRDKLLRNIREQIKEIESDTVKLIEQKLMEREMQNQVKTVQITKDDAEFLGKKDKSKEKKYHERGIVPITVLLVLAIIIILIIFTPSIKRWRENRKRNNTFNP